MKRPIALSAVLLLLTACGSDGGETPADPAGEPTGAVATTPPAIEAAEPDTLAQENAAKAALAADTAASATSSEPPAAFAQCKVCHAVEPGKNGVGPSLAGVFGAQAGHEPKFNYSPALRNSGKVWDDANLHAYLENPRTFIPGNRMSYAGLRDEAKRQEVIDYLKTL